jgi:hypothetical protein
MRCPAPQASSTKHNKQRLKNKEDKRSGKEEVEASQACRRNAHPQRHGTAVVVVVPAGDLRQGVNRAALSVGACTHAASCFQRQLGGS